MINKLKVVMYKTLSRNDTGETNSHQSGISIPQIVARTAIFPHLGTEKLNPRVKVTFFDEDGEAWQFEYIYYNDKFHGKDALRAHNEFRMTCVKDFLRKVKAKSGDKIWFGLDDQDNRYIGIANVFQTDFIPNIGRINISNNNKSYDTEIDIDDIKILDPDEVVKASVIKINRSWTKIEYK